MSKDKGGKKNKSSKKDEGLKKNAGAGKLKENGRLDGDGKDETFRPEDLAQSITQAARSMRTALSHNLAESGLYAGQDGVILALAEEGCMTPGQIAQKLGVKAPTMTRTIGRMEAQGFVERGSDDDDGRLTLVRLTGTGLKSVDHIHASLARCSARAIDGLSPKDVRTVVKLLRAIDANLQPGAAAD